MSPARVELLDPAGGAVSASWRPQETLGPHVFDATVRNLNRNRTSPVRQGNGKRARLGFAITTGDLPDNSQRNETQWMVSVLDGGRIDPFSGKPISATNQCQGASAEQIASLNADVAARRYTGVQDYDDYPAATPAERRTGFWDPDAAPGGGVYASFPRYPGLLERALQPFTAEGLKVPWYSSRGNHDGLVQGNAPASSVLFRSIGTGCMKIFPSSAFDPATLVGRSADTVFAEIGNPLFAVETARRRRQNPPDPDRAFVSKPEYKQLQDRADSRHGFGWTERAELRASRGTALYYSFSPRRGLRMIALDTVAEGGGASGNVDDPQYRWLKRTLRAAARRDELVIVYSHHTLETMTNRTPDEEAGCSVPTEAGCDGDPRRSTPLHLGLGGKQSIRDLLLGEPHVIAYVNGHTHHNAVRAFKRGRHGFWQVNTAAHIDFPQQSRQLELMDNRDGTLSLFGTILDTAAPIAARRRAPRPPASATTSSARSPARSPPTTRRRATSPAAADRASGPTATSSC